uniref:RecQ-mediated genome instability protein 1 n=1 Tax=Hucho hucho TaxID=62062 RepID=A0A4W5KLZ9_9TELE
MLLLQLTDGVQTLEAMEYQPIPALSTTLKPGVKLQLQGQITCRLGLLLLKPGNIKVLGGEVEELGERHSQGKVLCRALGLPEEEPPGPVPPIFCDVDYGGLLWGILRCDDCLGCKWVSSSLALVHCHMLYGASVVKLHSCSH